MRVVGAAGIGPFLEQRSASAGQPAGGYTCAQPPEQASVVSWVCVFLALRLPGFPESLPDSAARMAPRSMRRLLTPHRETSSMSGIFTSVGPGPYTQPNPLGPDHTQRP